MNCALSLKYKINYEYSQDKKIYASIDGYDRYIDVLPTSMYRLHPYLQPQ